MAKVLVQHKYLVSVGTVACIALMLLAALGLDRMLTRKDRIHAAKRRNDLLAVYDQILRYEHENLELPQTLSDLIPYYLRAEQLSSNDEPLYRFDRMNRLVRCASDTPVRGLVRRTIPAAVMNLPAPRDRVAEGEVIRLSGGALSPVGPAGEPPPAGAIVIEAEHYTDLNYGWEVHADPACGGGAYAHSKEGMANGPGQTRAEVYDFYNIREKPEFTRIRWHFHMAKAGAYTIYGRIWTTGSHCSNCIIVGVDRAGPVSGQKGYDGYAMKNITPFRWVWTPSEQSSTWIEAGDHFLEAYLHEDGVRVDQFILSPDQVSGDTVFQSVSPVNQRTAFREEEGTPVAIAFDIETAVVSRTSQPACNLTIRRIRGGEGTALIRVWVEDAGPDGAPLELGEYALDLAGKEELIFVPLDLGKLDFSRLPRREYLLVAEATRKGAQLGHCHVPLVHPFQWEVYGPLPLITNNELGPLDGERDPTPSDGLTGKWTPFKESCLDRFGVLDFGLQTIGNSLHAPQNVTIYARTRIHVSETGEYLLKTQSDDQMILWIDGVGILHNDGRKPVTRSAVRLTQHLEQGDHTVRMRVNQWEHTSYGDGRWQACLLIRTADDELSNVTSL